MLRPEAMLQLGKSFKRYTLQWREAGVRLCVGVYDVLQDFDTVELSDSCALTDRANGKI